MSNKKSIKNTCINSLIKQLEEYLQLIIFACEGPGAKKNKKKKKKKKKKKRAKCASIFQIPM